MKYKRITIARMMVLVGVIAVDWAVMRAGLNASDAIDRHRMYVSYSWIPDLEGETTSFDIVPLLEDLSETVSLLALGGTLLASLLVLGFGVMIRDLVRRGRCS